MLSLIQPRHVSDAVSPETAPAPSHTETAQHPTPFFTSGDICNSALCQPQEPVPLVGYIPPQQARPAYVRAKRAADVLVAGTLLFALAPLVGAIAVAIWAHDGGPVFYSQTRIGENGRPFRFFKFRSMEINADSAQTQLAACNEASGPIFKMEHDPRVTPPGKVLRRFSLDELPQLVNVLKGDMSLVGPRPHRPGEVAAYQPHQLRRLSVQPGLVCLREVSGRSKLSFDRWVELDLDYVEHRGVITDLRILCRAVPAVLGGEGAY